MISLPIYVNPLFSYTEVSLPCCDELLETTKINVLAGWRQNGIEGWPQTEHGKSCKDLSTYTKIVSVLMCTF